ncbi:MAG TPA: glycosyltransferase family 2 protein [Candidatus Omnitrophota bacterium]|nr:glycosyltransferase family 2 protein [Candidatus Omnitrophota bacterium]
MIANQRLIVVMPAYNAAKTLEKTYREIPHEYVDEVILVDDASQDETIAHAKRLGITSVAHAMNTGYGGNQKTCYRIALEKKADIVVMLHPDYQYDPRLIVAMASMVASGVYDVVLGSRILGNQTLKGGMPLYKYVSNRLLTLIQNLLMGTKLSEFHTGYRAFHRRVLEALPLHKNSDDFLFDNQMLAQCAYFNFRIGEISCPTKYFPEASSINLRRSLVYGLGVLKTSLQFRLQKLGLSRFPIFYSKTTAPHA